MLFYKLVKLIFVDIMFMLILIFFYIVFHIYSVLSFFTFSEYFWLFLFFFSIALASFLNDPRVIIVAFIILFLATVELIIISLFLVLKLK